MQQISSIIILILLLTGLRTNAQTTFAAVQTKTGFTRLDNDSVVLTPAAGLRGALQWQSTTDLVTWIEVASNLPGSKLAFKPQTTQTYRLKITEGTCNHIYGDTIKVFAQGTTPGAYIQAGILGSDLIAAGILASELYPTLSTSDVSAITQTGATSGGNVTSEGCLPVTVRGVCWSTSPSPTIGNNKTTDGSGVGVFNSSITGLAGSSTYHVRAYASNAAGTSYGTEKTFTTLAPTVPAITTNDVINISQTTATSGGSVTSDGGSSVTSRGVCWNTSPSPTISNNKTTDGSSTGDFSSSLTGLTASTKYYVRAYATNGVGTSYGAEKMFTTLAPVIPAVNTADVSSISQTTATSGGTVTSDGGSPVTSRGVCWNTSPSPTISNNKTTDGTSTGDFSSSLTGLISGTTYYVRAYATNGLGTSYGIEKTFTTIAPPAVATTNVSNVSQTTATSGGVVTSDGGSLVTSRGVCWNTTPSPTISNNKTIDGSGTSAFTSSITGLTTGTLYYVRAYATNAAGTSYGTEKTFTTLTTKQVADVDGNVYDTITIGTQVWMKQNLATTKYNDGSAIPLVTDAAAWSALTTPAYCWYNNDSITNRKPYGALYNWYTVNTAKLCPTGWHVSTDAEWTTLTDYLGGTNLAGGKLKETGTTHWLSPNLGADNSSGFTAVPGGWRNNVGYFDHLADAAYIWSATEVSATTAWTHGIYHNTAAVSPGADGKMYGNSVRCVRN